LDGDGELPDARMVGIVRVDQGISHAAAGPSLASGFYRLVAIVEAYPTGHRSTDAALWRETVSGELLHVAPPPNESEAGDDLEAQRRVPERLLADGLITAAEHAELRPAGAVKIVR